MNWNEIVAKHDAMMVAANARRLYSRDPNPKEALRAISSIGSHELLGEHYGTFLKLISIVQTALENKP